MLKEGEKTKSDLWSLRQNMTSFTLYCSNQEVCIIQLYPSDELLSLYHCQHRRSQKQRLICVPVLCSHKYNYSCLS